MLERTNDVWRRRSALLVFVLSLTLLGSFLPGWSAAQEGEAAPAAAAAPAGEGGEAPTKHPSKLMWFLESSGWIGAILLVLSIYFIATVSRLFVEFRPQVAMPPDIIAEAESLLEKRDFKGIYSLVKEDDSDFSRLLAAGITELSSGLAEGRDAMERVNEVIVVNMEKKISMLAVLGTLGPMIGLLGTLKGMIGSFSVIALSDTQLKASEVAGGISEALILTFEGVGLSVPAIYFFAVFRNRLQSITTNTLLEADEFLRRLSNAARGKGGAAPATAAPPKAPTQA